MRRTIKRALLSIALCIFTVVTCALGFVACNKGALTITFKQPPYTYARYNVADAYDLIEREAGVDYSFAYSYLTTTSGGEAVESEVMEFKGNTIYLNEISRYTLYVTATRGKESVTGYTQFEVVGEAPVLLFPAISLVYNVGSRVRINILLDKANPTAIPSSSELTVDYYTYQESQAPSLTDSVNDAPKEKTAIDTTDPMARAQFDKLGVYEFHVVAKNGDAQTDATFTVKVLPDQSTAVEGISAYKGAEFGEKSDGTTDSSVIRLVGSPDLSKASYAVLEDDFKAGQVARFEFYGRNLPYIGLFNEDDVNAAEPNNAMNGGYGYMFTMERATVANQARLYGCLRINAKSSPLRSSSAAEGYEHEMFGFNDLVDGTHYALEIMMKPTGKLSENKTGWGGAFLKGGTYQSMGLYFTLYEINDDNPDEPYTTVAYSSARFAKDIGSWFEEGEEVKGKLVAYSSISKDVTFKYHKDTLLNSAFDKEAISFDKDAKTLSWTAVDGAVNYIVTTGNSEADRIAVLNATTTTLDLSAQYDALDYFQVLNVTVYATIGNNTYSDKKYELIVVKEAEGMEGILVSGDMEGYDIEKKTLDVSLAGGYYNNSAANTEQKNKADTTRTAMGYVAFDKDYALDEDGTYIDIYFQGNNMPSVEFFATEINGLFMDDDGHATDGKGFIVSNGTAAAAAGTSIRYGYSGYSGYFNYGVSAYNDRWNGSEGWHLGKLAPTDGSLALHDNKNDKDITMNYSNFSMYSLANVQAAEQNYCYTVGMYKDALGYVYIESSLYKVDGEKKTLWAYWQSPVAIEGKSDSVKQDKLNEGESISGKIVLHAAAKGVDDDYNGLKNVFTCSVPYAGDADTRKQFQDARLNEDGTVSVKNGAVKSTNEITKLGTSGYIVLDNDYQLGEYVEIYFTGNNMPNLSFFTKTVAHLNTNTAGFLIWRGSKNESTYMWQTAGSFLVYSPNRVGSNQDNVDMNGKTLGSNDTAETAVTKAHALSMYRLATDYPTTKFKMTVGFYENADGYIEMSVDVDKFENDAWVDYFAWTKASTLDAENDADKLGKYLIAYGTHIGSDTETTFGYKEPYKA